MDATSTYFDLQLRGSTRFPRELNFKLSDAWGLSVWMFAVPNLQPIGYASSHLRECSLSVLKSAAQLRIGTAMINLQVDEAARIWTSFRAHGLRLDPFSEFPCAGNPSLPPAKQAATATFSPIGGDRGVSPPSVCTDGGALELDDCTIAHVLTAHESY